MVHPHREVLPPKSRFGFLADDHSLLLVDCHSQLPPVLNCDPSETLAGEKGTACVPKGGSDPRLTWAAESRKNGVAPAQFDFFPRPLSLLLRLYLFADRRISIWRGEEFAPKKMKRVISTFFTLRAVQGHIIGQWNLALDDPQAVSLVLARLSPLC